MRSYVRLLYMTFRAALLYNSIMTKFLCSLFLVLFAFSLRASDTINNVLLSHDFSPESIQALLIENPLLAKFQVAKSIIIDSEDDYFALKVYDEKTDLAFVIKDNLEEVKAEKLEVDYKIINKKFEGIIHKNLYDSIFEELGNAQLATNIAEAFSDDISTTKGLKLEASYFFEVESYFDNDQFIKFGNVLSASAVVGSAIVEKILKINPETKRPMLFPLIPDSSERIFVSPVGTTVVSSVFNLARRHPVKRRIQPHNGIDFRSKKGTPVFPALDGKVIAIGRGKAKGKFVLIEHENGMQSTYDHLSKFQKGLRVGMRISTDQSIGLVGRTGYATGAHLHFGLIKNGYYVNPLYYLKDYQLDQEQDPYQNPNADQDEIDEANLD